MLEKCLKFINNNLALVLASILVVRLAYLFSNGLDLIGDESYYWDWSRKPDWCYYSKPPMVAWLIGVFTWLGGDYTAVVRLPAVLLGTVFLSYFYATARAFYNPKAAAFALLLILATPFNVIANLVMTIDPPLFCFWMMSLYYLHKALFKESLSSWLWAGLATSAAILSKQVALLLPLMLICFLLLNKERRVLFKREFWLYLLPIILCLIPLLIWNQQHDWVMVGHSKGHFEAKEAITFAKRLTDASEFWLFQLLLVTPIFFVLILIMATKTCSRFSSLNQQEQFLMLTGPILLLGILALSLVQKVQGNWPVPFYFSSLILLSGQWLNGRWQKSLQTGLIMGFLMIGLTYTLPLGIQLLHLQNSTIDLTSRFRHWQKLATSIEVERKKAIPNNEQFFVLALGHRFLASQLAFYLPDHPQVFRYEEDGKINSQYEIWPGPVAFLGKTGLIVSEQSEPEIPKQLKASFEHFTEIAAIVNPMNENSRYHLFIGKNLKYWPSRNVKE